MPELYPFQKIGAAFLASRRRAGLFDDMGVGKSAQACAACRLVKAKRILIVCQASLRVNWAREWRKFGDRSVNPNIVSYNFIRKIKKVRQVFDVLIADESQNLGKWSAKQTRKFVKRLAPKAKRIWLLSGSPAVKSAADYHPQLSILQPGKHGKFKDFCAKYCNERQVGFGRYKRIVIDGFKNEKELNRSIKQVSLRRTQEEVLPELPTKRFSTFYVDIPIEEVDYEEVDYGLKIGKIPESIIPPLRQLGLDKAKEASDYLHSFYRPTVIFCWFRDTVDYIYDVVLRDRKVGLVTGKQTAAVKQKHIDKFQAGKLDFLVCNIAAGGIGHNFTRASTCVFIELPFSPALYDQSWRRLLRIGQKNKVHVVNVIAEDSLDERILKILKKKSIGMRKCLA